MKILKLIVRRSNIFLFLLVQFSLEHSSANNIHIINPTIYQRNSISNYAIVQFDIIWENSWRHNAAYGGGLSYIGVVNGGSGYTSEPTVMISGGGGSGATANAEISGGSVTKINIINPGSGYTSLPNITFSGGEGLGASADAHIHSWWDAAWVFLKYKTGEDYQSEPGVVVEENTITVSSTTGLRVGMIISSPADEICCPSGKFPPTTVVTEIISEKSFRVSEPPYMDLEETEYIIGHAPWKHCWLHSDGHTAPLGCQIDIGLRNPELPFNQSSNPGIGAFVYRSEVGTGDVYFNNVKLRWNYGENGVSNDDEVEIKVLAVEMIYIPESSFYVGSGSNSETDAFHTYPNTTVPYLINSSDEIPVGTENGNLFYRRDVDAASYFGGDQLGPIPTSFPNGYTSFYCMKYEITQLHYVEFLNTLSPWQASMRFPGQGGSYRNGINLVDGEYKSSFPFVACNYLSWNDLAAVLDWTGLRPMTELEFEKGCRGPKMPTPNEYAWGNNLIIQWANGFVLENNGSYNESIIENYQYDVGNASFALNVWNDGGPAGPLRSGIFATSSSNRMQAGASYYGVMELSGNLWERIITVGRPQGRQFNGRHGDGILSIHGSSNEENWPTDIDALGVGLAGGNWRYGEWILHVSSRYHRQYYAPAFNEANLRGWTDGGRGVRTAP
jgi:formylglycine-generating enzyme required for sulfatase activity